MSSYQKKYLKYKLKYLDLKNQIGGANNVILKTGALGQISDELFDDMTSWILYSLREIMGFNDIREKIILDFCDKNNIQNVYRRIHTVNPFRSDDTEVITYCNYILQDNTADIYIFTGSNLPDPISRETHYNIFVIIKSTRNVIVIDPASKRIERKGEYDVVSGIYEPYLANQTIIPFFRQYGFKCNFLQLTHPAQISESDVFCQTWTIILLLSYLPQRNILINIPKTQPKKYQLLLDFYKLILNTNREIYDLLNKQFLTLLILHLSSSDKHQRLGFSLRWTKLL